MKDIFFATISVPILGKSLPSIFQINKISDIVYHGNRFLCSTLTVKRLESLYNKVFNYNRIELQYESHKRKNLFLLKTNQLCNYTQCRVP